MIKEILYCNKCDNYTLDLNCKKCNSKALSIKPPKYNPDDKFGEYRRKYKQNEF